MCRLKENLITSKNLVFVFCIIYIVPKRINFQFGRFHLRDVVYTMVVVAPSRRRKSLRIRSDGKLGSRRLKTVIYNIIYI